MILSENRFPLFGIMRYKIAASISRIFTFGSRRFTASVRSMKPYVRKIHVEKTSR
jgi:hypothetical protein